jgi:uncharacterized membrane protein
MNDTASGAGAPWQKEARYWLRIGALPVVVVVGIWVLIGFLPWTVADVQKASRFGDSVGFISSVFSAISLVGILIAIVLQSQELKLQRKELRATRQEMKAGTTAQERSEEALAQQVRFLFLTTYINGLNTAIACYDDMLTRSELEWSQNHWLFRLTPLRQEVTSLVERLRPLAVQLMADSPARGEHLVARLVGCSDYLRRVPAGDRQNAHAWQVAFDDVTEELAAIATLAAHVSTAQKALVSEAEHLKNLQKSLPKDGELAPEHVKAIDEAILHFEVVQQAVSIALAVP